jgi:Rod binding domain-containing protein
MPINGQGTVVSDPSMGFSTSSVSKALSLNPEIAVKSLGQMKAGGIAPLSQEKGISLTTKAAHTPEEMQKVSKQFESIFLRMLLKEMRSTVEKDPLSGNDRAMEMFQSMQDDQFADTMSQKGIGIGDMVYRQMMSDTLKNSQKMGSKPI